jgi:hypothetical protein
LQLLKSMCGEYKAGSAHAAGPLTLPLGKTFRSLSIASANTGEIRSSLQSSAFRHSLAKLLWACTKAEVLLRALPTESDEVEQVWLAITDVNTELHKSLEAAAAETGAGLLQLIYDEARPENGVQRNLTIMQTLYADQAYFWEIMGGIVVAISKAVQAAAAHNAVSGVYTEQ